MSRAKELAVTTIPWHDSGGGVVVEADAFNAALAELERLEQANETLTEVNRALHGSAVRNRDGRKLAEADAKRKRLALEGILYRCEVGDRRTDWLPIIASLAREALAAIRR